jgi:mercuric reductase
VARVAGKEQTLGGQKLLVATGRRPNTEEIGLGAVGVEMDERSFVKVNDELQTSIPGIWAAGDVIGNQTGSQFATSVGAHDGVIAAMNALGNSHHKVDHRVIPRTIFTDPQVAVVGQTHKDAVGSGIRCWCSMIPLELVGRTVIFRLLERFLAGQSIPRPGSTLKPRSAVSPHVTEEVDDI